MLFGLGRKSPIVDARLDDFTKKILEFYIEGIGSQIIDYLARYRFLPYIII